MFLCVCQYGHSRSVALTRVLHGRGYHAVAVGVGTAGTAFPVLCGFADTILLLDKQLIPYVAPWAGKVTLMDVGPDVWSNPYNADLLDLLGGMVDDKLNLELRATL